MTEPERLAVTSAELLARVGRLRAARHPEPPGPPDAGPVDDPGAVARRALAEARQAANRATWATLVPAEFRQARPEGIEGPPRECLDRWRDNWGDGINLVVTGPVGTGKTWFAFAAVRGPFSTGTRVAFWPVVELAKALDWHHGDAALATFDRACRVGLLVLDDLGVEQDSDWLLSQLYGILNRRWLDNRPTVATTNLGPVDLEARLGERIYSRLCHDSTIMVRLSGHDRRRQPQQPRSTT